MFTIRNAVNPPAHCDWCDTEIMHIDNSGEVADINIPDRTTVDSEGKFEQKKEGDDLRLKIACPECGYINVVVFVGINADLNN